MRALELLGGILVAIAIGRGAFWLVSLTIKGALPATKKKKDK